MFYLFLGRQLFHRGGEFYVANSISSCAHHSKNFVRQEVGSAEAAKVTAGIQRAEIDDQVAWRTAKKISADGQMQQDKPHEQEQCISLMSIRPR